MRTFSAIVFQAFLYRSTHHFHRWLYRIRPAVAHQGFTALPENPDVR
jgi:homogentisate 1,2-dioxygenase